jgi:hypothetical protein
MTNVDSLVIEALTREWQAEPEVVAYVRRHAKPMPPIRTVLTTLDLLASQGRAQAERHPGYKTLHWRRV